MKQFFLWLLILIMLFVLLIYSMGKLADSRTDQIFARAHLVEVKSGARTDYINSMMPLVTMLLGIAVIAGMVVIIILIVVVGILAGIALTKYLMHHQQTQAALARPVQPTENHHHHTTIVLHIEGTPRQAYRTQSNILSSISQDNALVIDVNPNK